MPDLNTQVTALRQRISTAQAAAAKAEAQAEVARDRLARAEKALKQEFGCTYAESARAVQALEADLGAEAERVREALERAGAGE